MGCVKSKSKQVQKNDAVMHKTEEPKDSRNRGPVKNRTFILAITGSVEQDYELGEEIGRGGFSIVKEATSRADGTRYAVKIVEKSMLHDDIKLLSREIDIMKRVKHKNILKLHEIYEDDSFVYIVMELVNGSELFDRIVDKGFYSERNARHLITQILEAVQYLHSQGIAHRDLKPENLLCDGQDQNEVVKIADFGLSKMFLGDEQLRTSCGTPGYVAPEVLMCESYDKAVDMWGIGIITYILLAGYPPFYADNDTALFEKIMNTEYDFDDDCWDEVSPEAKDFISKLLQKNPDERYTAEQCLEHVWVLKDSKKIPNKVLAIRNKMEKYNKDRKEVGRNVDDTVEALNQVRKQIVH